MSISEQWQIASAQAEKSLCDWWIQQAPQRKAEFAAADEMLKHPASVEDAIAQFNRKRY
jgi:hypothetical protein